MSEISRLISAILTLPLGAQLQVVSTIVTILGGIFLYKSINKESRVFLVYQLISLVFSIFGVYVGRVLEQTNLWLVHLYTPIQFGFLMWVLSSWQENLNAKRLFQLLIPTFVLVWAIAALFLEHKNEFNTFSRPTESILLIIASGYTLFQVNKEKVESLFSQPSFWVGSGTLIYFTGMVILFTITNVMLSDSVETLRTAWTVQWIMSVIANFLYLGAFLCQKSRA
jgi:hypothetical protein